MPQTRSVPGWVITDSYEDEELGTLRAGKEAGCFLVRRSSGDRWCLLVRKDYRRRTDREYKSAVGAGERGIRRDAYVESVVIIDARMRRAAAKNTRFGREVREGVWAGREFAMLRRLWNAGASVPYPVEEGRYGFLMQYVGTLDGAAPRLADLRPDRRDAAMLFERIVENLHVLVNEGIVHGDLSEYNVLIQHGRPWIIDLPQAIDLYEHPRGRDLLRRDVGSVCRYFNRRGVVCDPEELIADLLAR